MRLYTSALFRSFINQLRLGYNLNCLKQTQINVHAVNRPGDETCLQICHVTVKCRKREALGRGRLGVFVEIRCQLCFH